MPSSGTTARSISTVSPTPELAMPLLVERIYTDVQPVLNPECIERFCRVWAEVGRAILLRRNQGQ